MEIKTRNGIPTQKAITELCAKHGLTIKHLGANYTRCNAQLRWSGGNNDHAAEYVAADLREAGFKVVVSPARPKEAITGCMHIYPINWNRC